MVGRAGVGRDSGKISAWIVFATSTSTPCNAFDEESTVVIKKHIIRSTYWWCLDSKTVTRLHEPLNDIDLICESPHLLRDLLF